MPRAPKKCAELDCEHRVTGRIYCPEHTRVNWEYSSSSRTATTEHKQWRLRVLERDNYLCQIKGPTCTTTANEADHIKPHAFGGQLTMENGQSACEPCHARKTQKDAAEGRRRVKQAWEAAQG